MVVKLKAVRFTPLLYIRREINCVSRFLVKNLLQCDVTHLHTRAKRTYRAIYSQLYFSKYFYLGYIHIQSARLSKGGSVLRCGGRCLRGGVWGLVAVAGVLGILPRLAGLSALF